MILERDVSSYKKRELDLITQLEKSKAELGNRPPSSQAGSLEQQHAAMFIPAARRKATRDEANNEMSGFDHEAFKSTIELLR